MFFHGFLWLFSLENGSTEADPADSKGFFLLGFFWDHKFEWKTWNVAYSHGFIPKTFLCGRKEENNKENPIFIFFPIFFFFLFGRKIPQGFEAGSTKFLGRGNFLCLELVPGKAPEVKPELGKLLNNERIRRSQIPALPMESGLVFPPLQIWSEEFILQIPLKIPAWG